MGYTMFLHFVNRGEFESRYPGLIADCEPMSRFMIKMNEGRGSDFEAAIRSQLLYCWELFAGIVKLVETGLPSGPMVLARSLVETAAGTQYLIADENRVEDFIEHGRYSVANIIGMDVQELIDEEELADLKKRFGRGWHGKNARELFQSVGVENLYQFYKEACSLSHGASLHLLIPRCGIGTSDNSSEASSGKRDYATMALRFSSVALLWVSSSANEVLGSGLESELHEFEDNIRRRGWLPNNVVGDAVTGHA